MLKRGGGGGGSRQHLQVRQQPRPASSQGMAFNIMACSKCLSWEFYGPVNTVTSNWQVPFLYQRKNLHENNVAELGFELATPKSSQMCYPAMDSSMKHVKVSDKMAYNKADPDQTAPESNLIRVYTVYHSTKYLKKQLH